MRRTAAALLGALLLAGAARAEDPPKLPGPPFDLSSRTPHRISLSFDTGPARDILTLIAAEEGAPAALRRLRASASALAALRSESMNPEDFFGRLVLAASGTPDPVVSGYRARAPFFRAVLDEFDRDRERLEGLAAARLASVLPDEPAVSPRIVVVPFIGTSGFREIGEIRDDGVFYFVAELPRLAAEETGGTHPPRELFLKVLRETGAEAWRALFSSLFRKTPPWAPSEGTDFEALLSLTAASGPPVLFLIPDEFFPLDPFFGDPVSRAFARWNAAAELLLDPKLREQSRRDLLQNAVRGGFWSRYPAVVGAQMADLLIRQKGRAAYARALGEGPRAVFSLYVETVKGTKRPDFSKVVKKALAAPRS